MGTKKDILNEYVGFSVRQKNSYYFGLTILIGFYLCFILIDVLVDFSKLELKLNFDWYIISFVFLLPTMGFIFLVLRKKIGWYICSLFFLLIIVAGIGNVILSFVHNNYDFNSLKFTLRQLIILALSFFITIGLFLENIRIRYRIKKFQSLVIIILAVFLMILLWKFG